MEEKQTYFSSLKQEVKEYIGERVLLLKLKAIKEGTGIAGMLVVTVIISFLLFFFFLFLGITLGFLLGDWLNSMVAAYAIVIVLYVAIIALIVLNRKAISARFMRTALNVAFPKDDEHHDRNTN